MKKLTALFLTFIIIGQPLAFANDLRTLRDYQNRAQKEWNLPQNKDLKSLLSSNGTITVAMATVGANIITQEEIAALEEANYLLEQKNKDLTRGVRRLKNQRGKLEASLDQMSEELSRNLDALVKARSEIAALKAREAQFFALLDSGEFNFAAKYAVLFREETTAQEKAALRKQLMEEPWFKAYSKEEQTAFLGIIEDTSSMVSSTNTKIDLLTAKAINHSAAPFAQVIRKWVVELMKPKNFIFAGVFMIFGLLSANNNAKAQRQITRIDSNFQLFVEADAQHMDAWEKDPEVKKAITKIADSVHILAEMTPQERAKTHTLIKKHQGRQTHSTSSRHMAR